MRCGFFSEISNLSAAIDIKFGCYRLSQPWHPIKGGIGGTRRLGRIPKWRATVDEDVTIASPCRNDAVAHHALQSVSLR